mmetsp:Transcript_38826/g.124466  ORF Transcript_38826/g.124466 Transcript_38826/m.124466 type:complete len:241 (+) Transcript_38826:2-724(+)
MVREDEVEKEEPPAPSKRRIFDPPAYDPPSGPPARSGPWMEALRGATKVYYEDDVVKLVYDGYPKARKHLLGLAPKGSPLYDVKSVTDLAPKHLDALREFHRRCFECAEHFDESFRVGYHSDPSMNWLHCHVVSDDFDSKRITKKKHYLSFATDFFLDANDLETCLLKEEKDATSSLRTELQRRASTVQGADLTCFHCHKRLPTFSALKAHLPCSKMKKKKKKKTKESPPAAAAVAAAKE